MKSFALALLVGLSWPGAIFAQPKQKFVLYGHGDEVVHVANLAPQVQAAVQLETKHNLAVGYFYRHFFILGDGFDLWTWDGKFVLFEGRKYFVPKDGDWAPLLGPEGLDSLGTPFRYRFPLGLLILAGIVALLVVLSRLFPSRGRRVAALQNDERYQEALRLCADHLPDGPATTPEEKAKSYAAALEYLDLQGIAPARADRNLRLLLAEANRQRSYELRYQAVDYEQAEEWELAIEHYEQAARLVAEWDPKDHAFLLQCIERVRAKQS